MYYDSSQTFINNLFRDSVVFYNSPFFLVIKILLGIYTIVLFINIVLLLMQKNIMANLREGFTIGMNVPPELTTKKKKLKAEWLEIKSGLESDNESKYKVAIIEADNLIDDLIKKLAFPGENMGERLKNIPPGQLDYVEELQKAHEIRNRIIHQEDFKMTKEKAKETFALYEKFLDYFGIMD